MSADHIVILILLLALVVKFVFFENKEDLAEQLRATENNDLIDKQNYDVSVYQKPEQSPDMSFLKRRSFFLAREPSEDTKDGKIILQRALFQQPTDKTPILPYY